MHQLRAPPASVTTAPPCWPAVARRPHRELAGRCVSPWAPGTSTCGALEAKVSGGGVTAGGAINIAAGNATSGDDGVATALLRGRRPWPWRRCEHRRWASWSGGCGGRDHHRWAERDGYRTVGDLTIAGGAGDMAGGRRLVDEEMRPNAWHLRRRRHQGCQGLIFCREHVGLHHLATPGARGSSPTATTGTRTRAPPPVLLDAQAGGDVRRDRPPPPRASTRGA